MNRNDKIARACKLERYKKRLARIEKVIDAELSPLKAELQTELEAENLESLATAAGTVEIDERRVVNIPRTQIDKQEFFHWCKDRGIFWEVIGINSKTLQKLYSTEEKAAVEAGEFDFKIPGISNISIVKSLKVKPK